MITLMQKMYREAVVSSRFTGQLLAMYVTYITPHVQLYTTLYVPCSTSDDILTVYICLLACFMSCISHLSIHSIHSIASLLVMYTHSYTPIVTITSISSWRRWLFSFRLRWESRLHYNIYIARVVWLLLEIIWTPVCLIISR